MFSAESDSFGSRHRMGRRKLSRQSATREEASVGRRRVNWRILVSRSLAPMDGFDFHPSSAESYRRNYLHRPWSLGIFSPRRLGQSGKTWFRLAKSGPEPPSEQFGSRLRT